MDCIFCREDGGDILWKDDTLRVVLADEPEGEPLLLLAAVATAPGLERQLRG